MEWFVFAGTNFSRLFFGVGINYEPDIEISFVIYFGPFVLSIGKERVHEQHTKYHV